MRPGQQNKRGRGRGNNNNNSNGGGGGGNNFNRKGSNPLTRTYDSSGPDVKIRGTAQHIAEKYSTLARDAQSAGDRVMAENYLQHAEHYNRIIASAQAQMQERGQRDDRQEYSDRDNERDNDRDGDDMDGGDNDDYGSSQPVQQYQPAPQPQPQPQPQHQPAAQQPPAPRPQPAPRQHTPRQQAPKVAVADAPVIDGSGPQPEIEGTPAEVAIEEEGAGARQPRRRNASNRPRRPRRTAEGGEGEAAGGDAPALADAGSE